MKDGAIQTRDVDMRRIGRVMKLNIKIIHFLKLHLRGAYE